MYVQPFEGSLNTNPLTPLAGNVDPESPLYGGSALPAAGDDIARFMPPWPGEEGAAGGYPQGLFGPLLGMLGQLMQLLQSLLGNGGCGNQRFFQNASGGSEGDPHLSFDGARWNSMASHPDLLNSGSIPGGFRISTQVTPPNGKGVTWNQSATITMNGGATTVGMSNNGQASIVNAGQPLSIAPGQTLQLGNGESVTSQTNGALSVTARNDSGGYVTTVLAAKGNGVDVEVTAHDIELGGALVNGYSGPFSSPIDPPWPIAPEPSPAADGAE